MKRRDLEEYGGEGGPLDEDDAQCESVGANRIRFLVVHAVNDVDLGCALEAWLPELTR